MLGPPIRLKRYAQVAPAVSPLDGFVTLTDYIRGIYHRFTHVLKAKRVLTGGPNKLRETSKPIVRLRLDHCIVLRGIPTEHIYNSSCIAVFVQLARHRFDHYIAAAPPRTKRAYLGEKRVSNEFSGINGRPAGAYGSFVDVHLIDMIRDPTGLYRPSVVRLGNPWV